MKDAETRQAILTLHKRGCSYREIKQILGVSRWFVKQVIESGSADLPESKRRSKLDAHRERIIEEIGYCRGNLVRVHEELLKSGIEMTYPTLAWYVRNNHLKGPPKPPAGKYIFGPGEESQFDTSPHVVTFSAGKRKCQCASLIMGYSRMLYFQYYPRFTRFESKIFLTQALKYFQGSCQRCIIDNTNIVILHGTGSDAVIVPEMEMFSRRFGFVFQAHRIGHSNRSGKIERPFHYIENNFLVKRVFEDFPDLNTQALLFCDRNNGSYKRHLKAKPVEFYAMERNALVPLPLHIPEVYEIHTRIVDQEGYINLHSNAYSVPYVLIGRTLEVRETQDRIIVYFRNREEAKHVRQEPGARKWTTNPEHRPQRGIIACKKRHPSNAEQKLTVISEMMNSYVSELKRHYSGRGFSKIRRLYAMSKEYPQDSFEKAVEIALHYGLFDLDRLETLVLRNIEGDYFKMVMNPDPFTDKNEEPVNE